VKNTLATVQSIANATLRRAGANPQHLGADLGARLQALARAHDLLTTHAWEATDLAEIAHAALAPWLDGMPARLTINGPSGVFLRPRQAQAVVLALHELATNAVKHGALSCESGSASLRWHTQSDGQTTMEWVETGGPAVVEPPNEKRGFGTRLLERALVSDLGSGTEVRLVFAPEGLRAHICFRHDSGVSEVVAA
jgi:two-component sensor histidine kinase